MTSDENDIIPQPEEREVQSIDEVAASPTRVPIPLPPSPPPPHPRLIVRSAVGVVVVVALLLTGWGGMLFTAFEPLAPLTATDPTSGKLVTPRVQVFSSSYPWALRSSIPHTPSTEFVRTILGHDPLVDPMKTSGVAWFHTQAQEVQYVAHYCQVVGTSDLIPQEDCHRAFPGGFDVFVSVSGSLVGLTRAGITSEASFVSDDIPASIFAAENVSMTPRRVQSDSTFSATNGAQTKTCRNAIDECILASLQQTSLSYDMVPEMQYERRARLLFTLTGATPLEMHRLEVASSPTEVFSVTVLLRSAQVSTTFLYRFALLAVLSALVPLTMVATKLLGKVVASRNPTFRVSIVPPSHQDVVDEGWEELLITLQHMRASVEDSIAWVRSVGWRLPAHLWYRATAAVKRGLRLIMCCRADEAPREAVGTRHTGGKEFQRLTAVEMDAPDAPSNSDDEGDICRICRVGDPTEDLIAPCACNGSSKFIHRACLDRWRSLTTNPEHQRVCAECKTEYIATFVSPPVEEDTGVPARVARYVYSRVRSFLSVAVGVTVCVSATFFFGYAILGLTAVLGLDSNVRFNSWDQAFSIGAANAATLLVVYVRGLPFVTDFPRTLTQRIPALYFLSVLPPLILGYAIRVAAALLFRSIVTPTVSFRLGACLFYIGGSLVGSLAERTMELCGDQIAGHNSPFIPDEAESDEDAHGEAEQEPVEQTATPLANPPL